MSTRVQEGLACEEQPAEGWIPAASPLVFPQVFGKYVLDRELASGGMARVYLATLRGAVGFEKRLVVKQIRPELASDPAFVRRFVDEAKTAVELSHPNIVPVYELGVEQGVYYIAMEFCAGATLAEILAETGTLSAEEGAYLGVEICRALDYAHRRAGIVHRDVTPRNVLVDEEGAVRLIDFGIAAPVTDHGPTEVFGSPGHMPPEQLAGKPLSPAADVFAVATLLFEAWTRKPPFRRATARASAEALQEPAPSLAETAPELSALSELFARSMARDPAERPGQAELFARPLRDFLRNADAGDVARRLGARVRKALRRAARKSNDDSLASSSAGTSSAPAVEGTPVLAASSQPSRPLESSGPAPTYTFAARGEVAEWTRRIEHSSSVPPPASSDAMAAAVPSSRGSGPSTRKLASIPPEDAAPADAGLEGVELGGELAQRAEFTSDEPARRIAPRASGRSALTFAGLALTSALAVTVVLVLVFSARTPAPRAARLAPPPAPQLVEAPPAPAIPAAVKTDVNATSPPAPVVSAGTAAVASARATAPSVPAPPASRRAAPAEEATAPAGKLRLTADPPASVSLQGASGVRAFTTPVRELSLPPGVYVVTFRNDTYGMPVVTRVQLEADSERSVHVDFREVEPRVSVR